MNNALYFVIRLLGSPLAYRCLGLERLPNNVPAIFVSNHLGSIGPIQMILSMPVRLYPWVIGEMVDRRRAPRYLYDDFIQPALRLRGLPGRLLSTVISQLAVSLLRGLDCVPVDRNRGYYWSPFRRSLALLGEGKSLLIFPEDPNLPLDPETALHPFLCGFTLLGPLYHELTGEVLPLIPAAVSTTTKTILIGEPITYQGGSRRNREEAHRVCDQIKTDIQRMSNSLADING